MTLAREINEKLDEFLYHQKQVKEIHEEYNKENFELKNVDTGEIATKEDVLNKANKIYNNIIEDLNSLTSGRSMKDMFTNPYYINDFAQDKLIAEEIRLNKMEDCLAEQKNPNNN